MPGHVDHVVRKERFLEAHPEAVIEVDRDGLQRRWHGQLPGHEEIVTEELGELIDRLEDIVRATNTKFEPD